mgnify:FL=1
MSLPAYTTPKQLNNKAGQGMTDFTQVPNKLITLKIPPAEKAILLVIARFTYGYQRIQCEMSLAQIAEYTDLSRRTVYKLVADLEKKGFLSVVRGKADGINTLNSYQLIDLYSGENISLGREEISLGVGKNLHGGRENISPSKESIKENINNIPPIVPPSGDVSGLSPASQSHVEPAKTTAPASKPAEPKAAKRKPAEPPPAYVLDQFEHFWQSMPLRKVGKDLAQRAFVKTTTGKTEAEVSKGTSGLLTDLAKRFKHIEGYDSSYRLLHPATYLNQRRWTDEDMPERKGKLPASPEEKANKLIVPEDIADGGTQLQKWAVAHGFRAAKGTERGWDYLQAVKAWAAEKNGGAV